MISKTIQSQAKYTARILEAARSNQFDINQQGYETEEFIGIVFRVKKTPSYPVYLEIRIDLEYNDVRYRLHKGSKILPLSKQSALVYAEGDSTWE